MKLVATVLILSVLLSGTALYLDEPITVEVWGVDTWKCRVAPLRCALAR